MISVDINLSNYTSFIFVYSFSITLDLIKTCVTKLQFLRLNYVILYSTIKNRKEITNMNNTMIYVVIGVVVFIVYRMIKNNSGNRISQGKAKEMMDGDVIIIDVRERSEYAYGHIKNAVLSPVSSIDRSISKITKDKNKTLLLYCQSGARSNVATQKLLALGYKNAYNFGGISSWRYGTVR